jgi:hypothetical protein
LSQRDADRHTFSYGDGYTDRGWYRDPDAYLHAGSLANRAVHDRSAAQPGYGGGRH